MIKKSVLLLLIVCATFMITFRSEIESNRISSATQNHNHHNHHETPSPSADSSSVDSADTRARSRRSSLSAGSKLQQVVSRDSLLSDEDEEDDDEEEEEEEDEEDEDEEDGSTKGNDQRSASVYDRSSAGGGSRIAGGGSRPASRSSTFSARGSSPARSMVNGDGESREPSESPEEDAAFETLDFRNGARETMSGTSVVVTTAVSRASYNDYDNELRNTDSNVTLYSCNSGVTSPKSASPRRFIGDDPPPKYTEEDSEETPPLPIGFNNHVESYDETDDVKPQPSRLPTPADLPRKQFKVSPCKLRPQAHCCRDVPQHHARRYHDGKLHVEKSSKAVTQCFAQLESKDWEVTLKGLRTLSQIARDEPEQLDSCAPGLLARVLAKHVKNLRSQVARVACTAAGEVFSGHVRGIDPDLDEIAGPLLHRTADTNKFLREDCNSALDCMIEHFPPNRTIMTIANRGACHQNTVVHATTARLLYLIVSEIGPEHVMLLPKEVKDKLFATTAKLLTDGNLQARKHAKETFRLLVHMDGFRKSLTDAVPESTLRLIDKTLRTL